jgi:hypothetical protein
VSLLVFVYRIIYQVVCGWVCMLPLYNAKKIVPLVFICAGAATPDEPEDYLTILSGKLNFAFDTKRYACLQAYYNASVCTRCCDGLCTSFTTVLNTSSISSFTSAP